MEPQFVINVRRAADDAFASGFYCAESVVLAFADELGLESELLPRLATGFCSGMGRMRGTCGALTGAIMAVGLALGRTRTDESVKAAYVATQQVVQEFEREFGARDCHVLLGCDLATEEGQVMFREQKLGYRCCATYTGRAAEIAARIVAETGPAAVKPPSSAG